MSTEMIRMVHPKTKGMSETTMLAFEIRGGHRDKGWALLSDDGALDDFPEERLRDAAAYWDVDLGGVAVGDLEEIKARLVKAPVAHDGVDLTIPSVLNPEPQQPDKAPAKPKASKENA